MTLRLNPYVVLEGTTREAVEFYQKALDAQLVSPITAFGDMPGSEQHVPAEALKLVMHAHLKVGESDLMFSDTFPGMPHQAGNTVSIAIHTPSMERSQQIFAALAEGAQVEMPLQKTDWSPGYGSLKDKFGVHWQINTDSK